VHIRRKEKIRKKEMHEEKGGVGGANTEHRCMMHTESVRSRKGRMCARTSNMEIAKTKKKIPEAEERSQP
jgi:hypothetical protein